MTRSLYLDDEHERHLELAARYLRLLGHLEHAHATDETAPWNFEDILACIDPLDLKIVGQELELIRSLYRTAPIRIAAGPRAATRTAALDPPQGRASRSDGAESPSPAATLPKVQCR